MREIIDKLDFVKTKNIFSVKDTQENEMTSHRLGEKSLQKTYLVNDYYPKYTNIS